MEEAECDAGAVFVGAVAAVGLFGFEGIHGLVEEAAVVAAVGAAVEVLALEVELGDEEGVVVSPLGDGFAADGETRRRREVVMPFGPKAGTKYELPPKKPGVAIILSFHWEDEHGLGVRWREGKVEKVGDWESVVEE